LQELQFCQIILCLLFKHTIYKCYEILFTTTGYRLQKIYILTSAEDKPGEPTLDKNSKWMIRSYRDEPYGPEATVILESDVLVKHVAVYSGYTEALSLAEVEVYEQDCKLYLGLASLGEVFFAINCTKLCFGYYKIINEK